MNKLICQLEISLFNVCLHIRKYDIIQMLILREDFQLIFQMFEPFGEKEAGLMNAMQLAYIGDAVWELFVRNYLIRTGMNVHHMHSECIRHVNARAQASYILSISDRLTDEEMELVRRGRNAHAHHPIPKNQSPEDYAMATAFEVLIGYLHLTGKDERIASFAETILGGN